ncbi:lantibiotic dehydratase [Longimycelium tulufanense]|nr:lantibiotic dehydratase [Longimycelium tulufanense]
MPGGAALLRLAGLPVRLWLAGGCPELFALLARTDAAAGAYRRSARTLAERLGRQLVPRPELTDAERVAVLELRRAFHRGVPVADDERVRLAERAAAFGDATLAAQLRSVVAEARQLVELDTRLVRELAVERRRLQGLPWLLLRSSPVGSAALANDAPEVLADIERRLAAGERWDGKRLRQRSDYLWRLVGRGAAKTTPRTWFGHLALAPVSENPRKNDTLISTMDGSPAIAGQCASHHMSNVHTSRHALEEIRCGGDLTSVEVSLTGLHWPDGTEFVSWVMDPADRSRMREVRLRETPALRAVRRALANGPLLWPELLTRLLGTRTGDPRSREVLTGFLTHLATLGVVQPSSQVTDRVGGWWTSPPAESGVGSEFVDVYRQGTAIVPAAALRRFGMAMRLVKRLAALVEADAPAIYHHVLQLVDARPNPVPDLVRRFLFDHPEYRTPTTSRVGWPEPRDPDSGYAHFLTLLANQPDEPGGTVDISGELLDVLDAPGAEWDWPADCVLRPLPPNAGEPLAVLEAVGPPGVLDARFCDGLRKLSGAEPDLVVEYREFLREVERIQGGRFVEVLVPPLGERAANAVRRPHYTPLWTGDPDRRAYYGYHPIQDYLPLHEITVRRDGREVIAEAHGARVWPIYHATRAPSPPWDVVLALLRTAGPRGARTGYRWGGALAAFPGRDHLPRITVGKLLVLSCAQWRVHPDELWEAGADPDEKFRALGRLVRRRRLPRWVFAAPVGGRPVPLDLASLPALRQLDRLLAARAAAEDTGPLLFEEMLPAPGQLLVTDTAHAPNDQLAAQLLLRIPADSGLTAPEAQAPHADAPAADMRDVIEPVMVGVGMAG